MKRKVSGFAKILVLCAIIVFVLGYLWHGEVWTQEKIEKKILNDGVERWSRPTAADRKPWFFQQFENLRDVILPSRDKLPFGDSVAFLVGVSEYKNLSPQLPFVENDLNALRDFLLNKGGFDTVYVARHNVATPELVKDYMLNKFRKSLTENDRLLFYYSGHGADLGGKTGYMQFSQAKRDDLARHVLAVNQCEEWSGIIPAKHILFLFDCCLSGLAFTPKAGDSDDYKQLLQTLSGNGSRTVITAGTAEEKTFGVEGDFSVFTAAFLRAFETDDPSTYGFMTTNQIFARLEIHVKEFARRHSKRLTPRRWELEETEYRGAFVFINPDAENVKFPEAVEKALDLRQKGEVVGAVGIIRLAAYLTGRVYIDGALVDSIERGDVKEYPNYPVGEHTVEVRGATQTATERVTVEKGQINKVTIRPGKETLQPLPPIDKLPDGLILVDGKIIREKDGAEMAEIPAGEFQMGSEGWNDDEKPIHTVYLDTFYIDKYEVTNAQYRKFIEATGHTAPKYWGDSKFNAPQQPVVGVSWHDAMLYCKWAGGSLPTEAQWEKAARGGLAEKKYPWGAPEPDVNGTYRANYYQGHNAKDGYEYTAPVGIYLPNGYGLYDMAGNVWEWCMDRYDADFYAGSKQENPIAGGDLNPSKIDVTSIKDGRVLRGGSWNYYPLYLRVARRVRYCPDLRCLFIGFRVVSPRFPQ